MGSGSSATLFMLGSGPTPLGSSGYLKETTGSNFQFVSKTSGFFQVASVGILGLVEANAVDHKPRAIWKWMFEAPNNAVLRGREHHAMTHHTPDCEPQFRKCCPTLRLHMRAQLM